MMVLVVVLVVVVRECRLTGWVVGLMGMWSGRSGASDMCGGVRAKDHGSTGRTYSWVGTAG